MSNRRRTSRSRQNLDRNQVARAVFETAESVGMTDRQLLEQLVQGAIQRLEQSQPLPGMEEFVPEVRGGRGHPLTPAEIRAVAKEVLAESGYAEMARAAPQEKEEPPPPSRQVKPKQPPKTQEGLGPQLSENALAVLQRRYLAKDSQGKVIETPEEMFRRVAANIASAELLYNPQADVEATEEEFYQLMANLEFLPNSPTLMNAGRELQQLSACFVLPIDDSMESIFDAVKYTALIHKSGGGTGFSFSRLRPESDRVGSTGGVASGPVSFMRAFDTATDVIKQGGMRRGANMAILNVDHPDILKFISAKEDNAALTNFNISVAMTEGFMRAVESGADYDFINPRTKEVAGKLNAKKVFDRIVDGAWRNGDPGIVFLDRVNQDNPTPNLGTVESTNPCGEQPLLPYESCNLGSINLSRMIHRKDDEPTIDYDKLGKTVTTAVRFLDNVIDVNNFPLDQIRQMTRATRKIGLGIMGFADMLVQLGIAYDSEEALKTAEEVMRFISEKATAASVELAEERGTFPAFEDSTYDRPDGPRVRNATRTTIAPTGTLSIIAGCSSGIEPLFAVSYVRQTRLPQDEGQPEKYVALTEVNPFFEQIAEEGGFHSEELMREVALQGSVQGMEDIPEDVQRLFVTALDISPEAHVKMQAAFQRHTDNAVSKTINFRNDATREDVARAFMLAYKEGCKGITIYRDRSRDEQILSTARVEEREEAGIVPRTRPVATTGVTQRVATGCGNLYVTVNSDEYGICEVFSSLGKAGGCASAQSEAVSRLISLALRSGVDAESIVEQLRGIRCPSISWENGQSILSCPDAIAGVLERRLEGRDEAQNPRALRRDNPGGQCPECSSLLFYQEGCFICRNCGYTRCE